MTMAFQLTKHHGLGNDFLVHLTHDAVVFGDRTTWIERARRWCDRRRGVGADGLIIGLHGRSDTDLVMTLVNADGSVAEMSGNGIRCLVQAEARRRGTDTGRFAVETDGGPRKVSFRPGPGGHPHDMEASVEMGPARPGPEPDRQIDSVLEDADEPLTTALAAHPLRRATFDLGNPHLVLLVEDPHDVDLVAVGSSHEATFDQGMNVHLVAPTPGEVDAMTMRVWERGAGVTEACGTGAAAVARAAHDWGLAGDTVTVHMPGGDVTVDVGDPMVLHGPATFIASIEVFA